MALETINKNKHVAVLLGGWSSERPVSLSSGESCAEGLENAGYRVTRVDVQRDIATVLQELNPDVAFNALHGPFGEGGTIQGILEVLLEVAFASLVGLIDNLAGHVELDEFLQPQAAA